MLPLCPPPEPLYPAKPPIASLPPSLLLHLSKEFHHCTHRVWPQHHPEQLVRLLADSERPLRHVPLKRRHLARQDVPKPLPPRLRFAVTLIPRLRHRLRQQRRVQHRLVDALAVGQHHMRRVPNERQPAPARPPCPVRQRVQRPDIQHAARVVVLLLNQRRRDQVLDHGPKPTQELVIVVVLRVVVVVVEEHSFGFRRRLATQPRRHAELLRAGRRAR
ncbi:hypothetical protein BBAD15_g6609 [Beauveria bassiana D1-5]|uniref:Uncharacterized protein n=1 Tax=Beauveria bassiana D1-5 TaxID=1245745 RepID=A0A0A2VKD7_BEABA|nr:hypothetical protein BBAD15_g6609 [Beauveria bassiana D1-5]